MVDIGAVMYCILIFTIGENTPNKSSFGAPYLGKKCVMSGSLMGMSKLNTSKIAMCRFVLELINSQSSYSGLYN